MEKKVQKILVAGALTLFSMAFAAPGWFVNTDVNQDFRYRLQEDKSDNYVNNAPRYRERLRYRLGLTARVSDEFTVGTRLATGDLESTKSRTDTFGNSNAFGAAAINLDQAYVSYSPKWIPGAAGVFKLTGGKFGLSTGVYTVTTIAWDSNISLEGKNLNYTYKDLGAKGLNLFANIGSYVLKTETPAAESATVDGGGYSNANLEIQQLGIQYKIANYSIDLAYAQYAIPNWDMANYEGIRYDDNKAITEIGAKLGAALSVPYFEKAALLYDDFTNPNIETKENKATAYGIEFGTAKVAKLGDYSLRYLDRSVGQNVGWAFLDDAHAVANTKGSQITLTLGIVENVNFVIDHYAFRGISDTDNNGNELSEYARDKLNTSSTRFELNVKF